MELEEKASRGWRLVIVVFLVTLGFSGTTMVLTLMDGAAVKPMIIRGSRFVLTAVLCVGIYYGRNWARLVMAFFCVMGTLAAVAMAARGGWTTPRALTSIGLAAVFAPLAVLLVRSNSIRQFLDSRRG